MAENSWPFEDTDTTELQWSDIFRRIAGTGTIDGLTVSSTGGMKVGVATGSAFVRGFYYENTAAKSLTVDTVGGSGRKDYIVRRLDLSANALTTEVLKGAATSGGGTLPTLTQDARGTWEVAVAVVTIPASAVNLVAANVVELPTYAPLLVIPYTGALANVTPDVFPALAVNLSTHVFSVNDGSGWVTVSAPIAWGDVTGKPSVQLTTDALAATRLSGLIDVARIPGLDAAKIVSGVLASARIPNITAAKISDQSNITAGDSAGMDGHPVKVQKADPGGADGTIWWSW